MQMQIKNPCIRCGRERVAVKTWEEKVGNFVLTHTTNVCPDPACQKIVDEQIAARNAKSDLLEKKRAEAKEERIKLSAANRELKQRK